MSRSTGSHPAYLKCTNWDKIHLLKKNLEFEEKISLKVQTTAPVNVVEWQSDRYTVLEKESDRTLVLQSVDV